MSETPESQAVRIRQAVEELNELMWVAASNSINVDLDVDTLRMIDGTQAPSLTVKISVRI